jgi:2-polyprenyl-6-methoxyphenol hydroxylase-like FAD-dependent oxidoreductase
MSSSAPDTDVLIVGAGPVGLFLANECARHRLRWRLVETNATQSEHSKALAIFPRTLEILDMAGIAAPFLAAANRVTSVSVMSHERRLAHLRFTPRESPYPFVAMVPQNVSESILAGELKRTGGRVEYETTFISAEQDKEGVNSVLDDQGKPVAIRASFLVGCDGAHSAVRRMANLPLEGGEYDAAFMLADIETADDLPADELQLCPSELGPLAIFPLSATRRRIVATIERPEGEAPSLDLVQHLLRQRAPHGIEARSIYWSSYFHIHHRHAARLRVGRVFIAGDAAHIHSPFGGQGMNTGLHDIWNLAWKLALFLRGHGNEQLLDSYTAERVPVIRSVIETTDRLTKVLGTPSRLAQVLRDTVIPMVSRLAPFQHAFVQRLSELGIDYHGSPIVEGPGTRYWDDLMHGGNGICGRFLLFVGNDADAAVRRAATQLCSSLREIVELRTSPHAGITLVRPDGYVAFRAKNDSDPEAISTLRSLLERQTNRTERPTSLSIA